LDELDEITKKIYDRMLNKINKPLNTVPEPKVQVPDKPAVINDNNIDSAIVVINDDNIDSAIGRYPLFILDFCAEWCGPCRTLGPRIEELAQEMKGSVVFGKINVDKNMHAANKYRISAIPTMVVFKNGKLVDKIIGAYPKATLAAKLRKYL
jgi:thioredoxin 1